MSHYMLSAPAGAGKTRTLCTTAVLLATQGSSAMLVSPTKRLTDQTARDIRAELSRRHINIEPGVIYGCDEAEGSVSARLTERLRAHRSSPIPGILLVTHEAFRFIPGDLRRGWTVFHDEEMGGAYETFSLPIPCSHGIVTQHVTAKLFLHFDDVLVLRPKRSRARVLGEIARNPCGDGPWTVFEPLAAALVDPGRSVLVDRESWDRLTPGRRPPSTRFHTVRNAEVLRGYDSVTFMGAFYERTLHARLWRAMDVGLAAHPTMHAQLDYTVHPDGHLVEVYWAFEDRYGARAKDHSHRDAPCYKRVDAYADAVRRFFGGAPFAWMANVEDGGKLGLDPATRLPIRPHGINDEYTHLDHVALFGSYNLESDCYGFLARLGIGGDEVNYAQNFLAHYQGTMRTSLRARDRAGVRRIVVPTRELAEHFREAFPGSRVSRLPDVDFAKRTGGREKIHASPAEKQAAYRARKKLAAGTDARWAA